MSQQWFSGSSLFTIHQDLDETVKDQRSSGGEQFIGMTLGSEEFLISIAHVQEILMLSPVTYIPQAPQYVEGVINLRGAMMPVLNMRKMLGQDRPANPKMARAILVHHHEGPFGMIVDSITQVITIPSDEIESQNIPLSGTASRLLGGIAKQKDHMVGILDPDRIRDEILD